MQKLFSTLYGSRLFGTQTPSSDLDIKHIVLPPLDDLLLGRRIENKVKNTNTARNTRNTAEDVDEEFIPIQVFARHFVEGQTYAIELAFSIEGTHADQTFWCCPKPYTGEQPEYVFDRKHHAFYTFVRELREKFLTSNIKAMMGYVVNQASLYSFKGERLNATRDLKDLFLNALDHLDSTDSTKEFATDYAVKIKALGAKYPKYFRVDEYDIGGGRMMPCFMILEKTLPFTNDIRQSLKVIEALENKYGARANQASESNVDWKATMHALRIVNEGLNLLHQHKIVFPFSSDYAQHLLSIKRGELPLDPIKEELAMKLDMLKDLEKTCTLPACDAAFLKTFDAWMVGWLRKFYGLSSVQSLYF